MAMVGRFVEITGSGKSLSVEYGSLIVKQSYEILGRIDLDEVTAVVVHPHAAMVSSGVIAALAERGIPLVIANAHFEPAAMLLAVNGNFEQAKRIEAQIGASKPTNKRLWQVLVRSKLGMQAAALDAIGGPGERLRVLAQRVRSGDPENQEGQAARHYWRHFFEPSFRRERFGTGPNPLLNYGYAILRAAMARAVVAAGLHPSIGIHHRNAYNGLRLVDDLIEPFRPLVDLRVRALVAAGFNELVPASKKLLAALMNSDVAMPRGSSPIGVAVHYCATSLAQFYLGETDALDLPIAKDTETLRDLIELPEWAADGD